MLSVPESYSVVNHIHDSFVGKNGNLGESEIHNSQVHLVLDTSTEKLHIEGEVDTRHAYQSLCKDKLGNYHLSTVFKEYGGEHVQYDFRPEKSTQNFDAIASSLFMKELVRIALARS